MIAGRSEAEMTGTGIATTKNASLIEAENRGNILVYVRTGEIILSAGNVTVLKLKAAKQLTTALHEAIEELETFEGHR